MCKFKGKFILSQKFQYNHDFFIWLVKISKFAGRVGGGRGGGGGLEEIFIKG